MTDRPPLLPRSGLIKLAGAHDVMGAKLAHEMGFGGVWVSSFELATSHGVADADVLSWRQAHAVAAEMAAAVDVPVVVDGEAGFGGPDVVRELVAAHDASGVAGICFEDAEYPRRCSLLPGRHGLAPRAEFADKIAAAVAARTQLRVLARLQALVTGAGLDEARERAHAYVDAGADAIVVHSRSAEPDEVLAFVERWDRPTPLVLIPTTYHTLSAARIEATGKVRVVIYANHGLRAAIHGIKRVFRQILSEGGSHGAETWIAGLSEAFALQGEPTGGAH